MVREAEIGRRAAPRERSAAGFAVSHSGKGIQKFTFEAR